MTPLQLITYYANLLILQYLQKPKAYATAQAISGQAIMPQTSVQSISFSGIAASGTFILNYTPNGVNQTTLQTAAINWNDSAATIQTKLRAVTGLSAVTVTGSIATSLVITFTSVIPVVQLLTVTSNSLATGGAVAIALTVAQTDVVLPLAVSNALNISSTLGAVAVGGSKGGPLYMLGKYVGVSNVVNLSSGQITLSDADFLSLVQFAAIKNSAGSDLSTIQTLLNQFFPNEVFVFDYQNMQMSYLISTTVGSLNLARALVVENLLLKPMGVTMSVIWAANVTKFFGFRTYTINTINNKPFNNYSSYNLTWPWMSYANAATP